MRSRRLLAAIVAACCLILAVPPSGRAGVERPTPVLSASPMIGVAPVKILFKAELRGGRDDDPEFYCVGVEWDWDDDSLSERKQDCEPYEAGKSRISRFFMAEHEYKEPGSYQVTVRLKRGEKVLTAARVTVSVT
jgi:hypothetical protein